MMKNSQENLIQEAQRPQEILKKQGLEVAVSAEADSLQEKLGVLSHAIGHDQPITDANLADLSSAVEGMKLNIGGKELTLKDAESLAAISNFLKETNMSLGVKTENLPTFKFEFINPKKLDYKNELDIPDKSKFGQYTLNPETLVIDFEKAKVFIPNLSTMGGKYPHEVFKYVVDTYGDKYYIPGIEYWKWVVENPDKAEEAAKKQNYDIKNGNDYFFLGSSLCDRDGHWRVPYAVWAGDGFARHTRWPGGRWCAGRHVVLLEKKNNMSEKPKENLIYETQGSQEAPNKQGIEISPQSIELQKTLESFSDAVSHDQPITAENLSELGSAVEGMKLNIGGKELTLKDAESVAAISNFLKETNTGWGVKEEDLPTFKVEFINPKEIDYKEKLDNPDKSKFGQYTLNPETLGMDFEKARIFIPDLSSLEGKKLHEVFKYVVDTYGAKYYIPDIEYWKWLIENPDKAEETAKKQGHDIKERNYYYFPGSSMCDVVGTWRVPYCIWDGRKFIRNYAWLEREWSPFGRFVLLERE